jgi:hypothetical protein
VSHAGPRRIAAGSSQTQVRVRVQRGGRKKGLTGGPRLPAREREGRRGRAGGFGPGVLSWAQKREREARGETGRTGKGEEKGARLVGPRGEEKTRRKNVKGRCAGPREKEREREKKEKCKFKCF